MSLNGVCIRSEQKIGPYKVCIFVNMGPYGKVAALIMTITAKTAIMAIGAIRAILAITAISSIRVIVKYM